MAKPTKPTKAAQKLLDEARADYARSNTPAMRAAAREQLGQARTNGNAAAATLGKRRS